MYNEFKENITRTNEGRFQVKLPWSPNHPKLKFNEQPARRRLQNTMRKLSNDPETKLAYEQIIEQQLNEGIIEYAPKTSKEERVFYMPHKPVVRKQATTTKVRMVHDASSKLEDVSLTQCLYIGPNLQPLLFDILARMRIHPIWIIGDVKQAFLQISIAPQDRDALRFLYISPESGKELHLRFTRLPFCRGPSPFGMGAVFRRLWDENENEFPETVEKMRLDTCVDDVNQGGHKKIRAL